MVMWVCKNLACKAHDVTLISAKDFSMGKTEVELPSNLKIIKTIEPSWKGQTEETHYLMYKDLLEKSIRRGKWNSVG